MGPKQWMAGLAGIMMLVAGAGAADSRPNMLVVLIDDMGFSDFACYGGDIPTPNIDALASTGLRFTQFYNCARCSPTRAALNTGLYPHEAGMGYLDNLVVKGESGTSGRLLERAVTIADVLGQSGYFTAMAGKWHMGQNHDTPPWKRGYQHSFNSTAGGVYFPGQSQQKPLFIDGKEYPLGSPELGKGEWYSTDLFTDWTMRYMDQAQKEKKPFFLYLPYCAVHFPLMAPAEDIARYRGKFKAGWDKLREGRYKRQIAMGLIDPKWPLTQRLPDSPAWDTLTDEQKDRFDGIMAVYAAMIDRIDQNIGRLVDHLKAQGLYDNTAIFIMSDNGGNAEAGPDGRAENPPLGGPQSTVFLGMNWAALANTPFIYFKHFTREGGIATPLVVHWPAGMNPKLGGGFCREPGHVVDIMPTCVDLAKATYPKRFRDQDILPMDGVSLVPAFTGKPLVREKPIFWSHEGNRAIRDGKWKLVSKYKEPWQLYDMESDRTEIRNLIDKYPEIAQRLETRYTDWEQSSFVNPWTGPARTNWGAEVKTGNKGKGKKKKKSAGDGE